MTILVSDSFNRPDGPLGVADVGGAWTDGIPPASIVGNVAHFDSDESARIQIAANFDATWEWGFTDPGNTRVNFRMDAPADSLPGIRLTGETLGYTESSGTQKIVKTFTPPIATGSVVRVQASAGRIRVWDDGVLIADCGVWAAPTLTWLRLRQMLAVDETDIDNLTVTDVVDTIGGTVKPRTAGAFTAAITETLTLPQPASAVIGDYALAAVGSRDAALPVTMTGWTPISSIANGTGKLWVFGRVWTGTDPRTVTGDGGTVIEGWGGFIIPITGVPAGEAPSPTTGTGPPGATWQTPTVTTPTNGLAVAVAMSLDNTELALQNADGWYLLAGGYEYETATGDDFALGLAAKGPQSGTTPGPTWLQADPISAGDDNWAGITLTFAPQPAPPVTPTDGLRVFIDETEIDCDSIGSINVTSQGYSVYRQGSPHQASVTLLTPWDSPAHSATKLQVLATMTAPEGVSIPPGVFNNAGVWEWIIFRGSISDRRGPGPNTLGKHETVTTWVGGDSNLLNRRINLPAEQTTHYRQLINLCATAAGITNNGALQFPNETPNGAMFYPGNPDSRVTIGEVLGKAGAAWGVWPQVEWDWDGNPNNTTFRWRPSQFLPAASGYPGRMLVSNITQAWLLGFPDAGTAWGDYYDKVVLTGNNNQETKVTGSYGASRGAQDRSIKIDTWLNNDPDCALRAEGLANRQTDPDTNTLYSMETNVLSYQARLKAAGVSAASADAQTFAWLHHQVGDKFQWDLNTVPPTWPTKCLPLIPQLNAVTGVNKYGTTVTTVSGWSKTWKPDSGWTVQFGIRPR